MLCGAAGFLFCKEIIFERGHSFRVVNERQVGRSEPERDRAARRCRGLSVTEGFCKEFAEI